MSIVVVAVLWLLAGGAWPRVGRTADLPRTSAASFVDILGSHNVLPKATDGLDLIASHRELESIVRTAGGKVISIGQARRIPTHWTDLPPVVQSVRFEPPLAALAVFSNSAEWCEIKQLEARRYFTRYPREDISVHFRLPRQVEAAKAVILLTPSAAARLREQKVAVSTARTRGRRGQEVWSRAVTTVDLNADGQADIAHVTRESHNMALCDSGGYGCSARAVYVAMRVKGIWYKTSEIAEGQDGPEGF